MLSHVLSSLKRDVSAARGQPLFFRSRISKRKCGSPLTKLRSRLRLKLYQLEIAFDTERERCADRRASRRA